MQVLDAENLLPVLDAAKFSASKVTQDHTTIVKKKAKINKGIYAVKLKKSFEFTQIVTKDAASFPASKVFQVPANIVQPVIIKSKK